MMRKNQFFTMLLSVAVLFGLGSCNKEDGGVAGGGENGGATGAVKVTLNFDNTTPVSYATASTAKPTTSWDQNINDLWMFFVEANGVIKTVREIPISGLVTGSGTNRTATVVGVPEGTYTAYMVANIEANNLYPAPGNHPTISSGTEGNAWSPLTAVGQNFAELYLAAAVHADFTTEKHTTSEVASVGYGQAPEIFVASQSGIMVTGDQTTDYTSAGAQSKPFALTRIVSIVRVRINQGTADETGRINNASVISFTTASITDAAKKPSLRIRRVNTAGNMAVPSVQYCAQSSDKANAVYYDNTVFFATDDPSYSAGTIVNASEGFNLWKDALVFPGGSGSTDGSDAGTGREKFDIVVTGVTLTDNYVAQGGETPGVGEMIAWTGAVTGTVMANNILEINITLTSAGSWVDPNDPDKPIPTPEVYGNLSVEASLTEWGNISSVDVEW